MNPVSLKEKVMKLLAQWFVNEIVVNILIIVACAIIIAACAICGYIFGDLIKTLIKGA